MSRLCLGRAIDDVLEAVVARIEKSGLDQIGTEEEKQHLAAFARRLPESAELLVADKYGTVTAAVPSLSSTINVRHREWFSTLKEHKAELAVGRAVRGRGFHDLIFAVARSIRGPDGTFLGAVQVGAEMTYLRTSSAVLMLGLLQRWVSIELQMEQWWPGSP